LLVLHAGHRRSICRLDDCRRIGQVERPAARWDLLCIRRDEDRAERSPRLGSHPRDPPAGLVKLIEKAIDATAT
jgi:hypothetical protein